MAQSQTIDDAENAAISRADATGTSDLFSSINEEELTEDFNLDFDAMMSQAAQVEESKAGTSDFDEQASSAMEKFLPKRQAMFESDDKRKKSLFEKMFGYNPASDLPYGYDKMTDIQRKTMMATLATQNLFKRTAIGATKQLGGTLQLALPKSMEEFLITDKEKKEFRLPEDRYYEARVQKELRKKQKTGQLSPDEIDQLRFLDETLPSTSQRLPEAIGRTAAFVEEFALSQQVFRSIKIPGGRSLDSTLSNVGKNLLGRRLAVSAASAANAGKTLTSSALSSLSKQIIQAGPNAAELFIYGVISSETEEGEDAKVDRLASGAKMSLWAAAPVILGPGAAALKQTNAGQVTSGFVQNVISKTVSPIADKLASMKAVKAKKTFVDRAMLEADDLFLKENNRLMSATEKTVAKKTFAEVADKVSVIAKKNTDDIASTIEEMSASVTGKDTVGMESIIPKAMRKVETAGDEVVNGTTMLVENRTRFATIRQTDRSYAILDKETQREVAVNIKRKDLAKELDDLVFGGKSKAPVGNKNLVSGKRTKLTITEETELKRSLGRMQKATDKAYRAGAKDANEKALIKLNEGRERLATVRADNQQKWENVEYARQLVKDFVPKEDQGLFMSRIIKSKTEGGLDKVLDGIDVHLSRGRVRNSVDVIRGSLKTAKKNYGDKTGPFAKAPDEIKPMLTRLQAISDGMTKFSQQAGDDIAGIGTIADDMISAINDTLSSQGEVIGIPPELSKELFGLSSLKGGEIGADGMETLAQLTQLVIHRAEQAKLIRIGPNIIQASQAVDDSISRIIPKVSQEPAGKIKKLIGVDSDHPITLIEKMFGGDSSTRFILDDLYEGEIKAFGVMRNSYGMVRRHMAENNISDDAFSKLKQKMNVTIGGKNIEITRDDALSLAMSTRDPWVFDQLTKASGFRIGKHEVISRSAASTLDDISNIISQLSEEEIALGGAIFDVSGNYLSQAINETSLQLNGIKIATYPQYYPSHRVTSKAIAGNRWAGKTAETQSNFMPRLGGKSPMRIKSYSAELMDYIQNSAMYNGTAGPMRSMKTVLADKGLQQELRVAGYGDEFSNLVDIISRSEGMYSDSSVVDVLGSGVLNRFTKSVLGGRISTIGTQIASVPAAKSVIPGKYFKPTDVAGMKSGIKDLETSNFFWHRWTGKRVSVELGDATSKSSLSHFIFNKTPLSEKPLAGLVWGDKQAAGKIYAAAKRQVAATTKLTGNELKERAIKITEKAFRETQPNWSVLTRSKLATDPSVFKRSLTMFRTAQEAQLNIWKRANVKFARSAKSPSDVKALGESYKAVLESQLSVALWKSTWKRGREFGVAKTAGWLGVYTPGDDDPFAEDAAKDLARAASGIVPGGQMVETLVEATYDKIFKGEMKLNMSQDPFSSISSAAAISAQQVSGVISSMLKDAGKREGFTADFSPVSVDDLLDEISTSDTDRKQKKQELVDKSVKAITNALRTAGMLTGLPVGPLDEWVAPGLKRSPHELVRRISPDNSSNPAELQRDLHKFLTKLNELKKKEADKGLTLKEATELLDMNTSKSQIDSIFVAEEAAGDVGENMLDALEGLF